MIEVRGVLAEVVPMSTVWDQEASPLPKEQSMSERRISQSSSRSRLCVALTGVAVAASLLVGCSSAPPPTAKSTISEFPEMSEFTVVPTSTVAP